MACSCHSRASRTKRIVVGAVTLAAIVAVLVLPSRGEVFHSKESALALAFPQADHVESHTVVLTAEQVRDIEARSRTKVSSKLLKFYEGRQGDRTLGFAFIETHTVRSLPETILVVVASDGRSRGVHLLAFHEPPEYGPTPAWLSQFAGRPLDDDLSLRRGVAGMAGSTLTATAITAAVRRILATFEVCVADQAPLANAVRHGGAAGRTP
jgi:hypothetical protein